MDACAQAAVIVLMLAVAGCAPAVDPPAPRPAPPFAGCLKKPPALPPIVTGEQVRARHDALEKLYDDCAARARRNAEAFRN